MYNNHETNYKSFVVVYLCAFVYMHVHVCIYACAWVHTVAGRG